MGTPKVEVSSPQNRPIDDQGDYFSQLSRLQDAWHQCKSQMLAVAKECQANAIDDFLSQLSIEPLLEDLSIESNYKRNQSNILCDFKSRKDELEAQLLQVSGTGKKNVPALAKLLLKQVVSSPYVIQDTIRKHQLDGLKTLEKNLFRVSEAGQILWETSDGKPCRPVWDGTLLAYEPDQNDRKSAIIKKLLSIALNMRHADPRELDLPLYTVKRTVHQNRLGPGSLQPVQKGRESTTIDHQVWKSSIVYKKLVENGCDLLWNTQRDSSLFISSGQDFKSQSNAPGIYLLVIPQQKTGLSYPSDPESNFHFYGGKAENINDRWFKVGSSHLDAVIKAIQAAREKRIKVLETIQLVDLYLALHWLIAKSWKDIFLIALGNVPCHLLLPIEGYLIDKFEMVKNTRNGLNQIEGADYFKNGKKLLWKTVKLLDLQGLKSLIDIYVCDNQIYTGKPSFQMFLEESKVLEQPIWSEKELDELQAYFSEQAAQAAAYFVHG